MTPTGNLSRQEPTYFRFKTLDEIYALASTSKGDYLFDIFEEIKNIELKFIAGQFFDDIEGFSDGMDQMQKRAFNKKLESDLIKWSGDINNNYKKETNPARKVFASLIYERIYSIASNEYIQDKLVKLKKR